MKFMFVAVAAALVGSSLATPAQAEAINPCELETARLVAEQLAFLPGGVETAPGVVSYHGGGITIEIQPASCEAVPHTTCEDSSGNRNYLCLWARPNRESRIVRIGVTNTWINLRALSPALTKFTSLENLHQNTAKIRKDTGGPTKSFRHGAYDEDTLDGNNPVGMWKLACVKSSASRSCR